VLGLLRIGVAGLGMDAWAADTLLGAAGLSGGGFGFGHGWWVFLTGLYGYISGLMVSH